LANRRIDGALRLDESVSCLKYVSPSRERDLAKLGIFTVRDLLYNPPKRYVDFTDVTPIASCQIGEKANVLGRVDNVSTRVVRRRMRIVEASIVDDTGVMNAIWFNQPWVANNIKEGKTVLMQGTVAHRGGFKQMSSPLYLVVDGGMGSMGNIRPVYRQTRGITSTWIGKFVDEALDLTSCPVDPLPVWSRVENHLMSRHCALEQIHHPANMQQRDEARKRLAYEELLILQLHWIMDRNGREDEGEAHVHVKDGPKLAAFFEALPFSLTQDQMSALEAIVDDMCSDKVMNRMLIGDVGTGKTIVAAGAIACVADSGSQGVLMAPTEVLARQYGQKIGPELDQIGVSWATLTSSTSAAERKRIVASLATGQLDVVFATHAVLEDDIVFRDLSLVIIDEQHRFGVEQREKLRSKGTACDYLCMTATPIPRSLALTIYGNLDCSYIRQRPGGNRDIETVVLDKRNRFAAFDEIRECVKKGQQAYIICPLIGEGSEEGSGDGRSSGKSAKSGKSGAGSSRRESDDPDDEDDLEDYEAPLDEEDFAALGENLRAARAEADYLQNQVFPEMTVGLLCGQMNPKEKSDVMEQFRDGQIDVLVSTTVVEVGVDVPNATLIVIEDAERFGLSQLHQLRGRVGRGEHPGKAILLASTKTEIAAKRMQYIATTQDGFKLADLDLSLRHEGDVVGSRQHGDSALRFSNVIRDSDLIFRAREDATKILESDPLLEHPVNALLAHEVHAIYSQEAGAGEGNR
jgi:ATP-dependent DNA helicase RecG